MSESIGPLLARFDFDTVEQIMLLMNWRWEIGGEMVVPTRGNLVSTAYALLEEAVSCYAELGAPCPVERGGFRAVCLGHGRLTLDFVPVAWDTDMLHE